MHTNWFFTQKMIGTKKKPRLKTKAAESFGLLQFFVHVLSSRHLPMDGRLLLETGRILIWIYETFKKEPVNISETVIEDM